MTFFTLSFSLSAIAQSYIGVYAGLNSGKFSGDAPPNFKYGSKLQYSAGIVFDLRIKDDVFISFAPSYLATGSKLQYPIINEDDEQEYVDSIELKIQLFTLPIVLQIISDNEKFQFTGGFEAAFPMRLIAYNGDVEQDITNDVNDVGVNMIFGIGYRIPIDKSIMVINMAYSQGLTNLAKNLDADDSYLPRVRLTSLRLSVSYLLPIGQAKN